MTLHSPSHSQLPLPPLQLLQLLQLLPSLLRPKTTKEECDETPANDQRTEAHRLKAYGSRTSRYTDKGSDGASCARAGPLCRVNRGSEYTSTQYIVNDSEDYHRTKARFIAYLERTSECSMPPTLWALQPEPKEHPPTVSVSMSSCPCP